MASATPGDSRYLALTTYRRDGRPVTTPVGGPPPGQALRRHHQEHRQGQAGDRHRPGAIRLVRYEWPPHPERLARGHGARR